MYRATMDIKIVQTMLGHEKPDTSAIYAHVPRTLIRHAIESMPVVL